MGGFPYAPDRQKTQQSERGGVADSHDKRAKAVLERLARDAIDNVRSVTLI